ncbi:MAG: LytR C-terminal domain-containing protein [Deltaproteobacteria bacterium]|nr:LytR C-terminal domain-containing protein [Deltaproteobacteria bacterium]
MSLLPARSACRSVLVLSVGLCVAAPAGAGDDPHTPLKRIDPAQVLPGKSFETFLNGASQYRFDAGGKAEFLGAMAAQGEGRWSATSTYSVHAEGEARGGPCMGDTGEDCDATWPWSVDFRDIWASESGLVRTMVTHGGGSGERYVFQCEPGETCFPTDNLLVAVLPGNADRTLFDAVLPGVVGAVEATVVKGDPAKNPRVTSEIWWVSGDQESEEKAKALGTALADTLGTVQPQEWTFGASAYDVILVVGREKVGATPPPDRSAVRVRVLDGKCGGQEGCTNSLHQEVVGVLQGAGYTLAGTDVAKNPREAMEVWYQSDKQEAAATLIREHLSKWLAPEAAKEWTWGGEFDVVVIVPPAP